MITMAMLGKHYILSGIMLLSPILSLVLCQITEVINKQFVMVR